MPTSALVDYCVCPSCHIVSRGHRKRAREDKCARCGAPVEGEKLFFPRSAVSLVCLMEEMFDPSVGKEGGSPPAAIPQHRAGGMVLLYCALVEVLLQSFLEKFMGKAGIPEKVQIKLFKDNVSVTRRIWELFLAITDVDWKDAVRMLRSSYGVKVLKIIKFYTRVVEARNRFFYGGLDAPVPEDLPAQCLEQVSSLLALFVALHNEYIAKLVF
jgi:hypothetical protein